MKVILLMVFFAISGTISGHWKLIFGRKPVAIEDVPYSVTLFYRGDVKCGGAMISEKHVLSAGHCVFVFKDGQIPYNVDKELIAVTGTIDPHNGGNLHRIAASALPKKYFTTPGFSHDLAVLTLMESVTKTPAQQPINLPAPIDVVPSMTRDALFVGLGSSKLGGFLKFSPVITSLPITLLTPVECLTQVKKTVHDDNICGVYPDSHRWYEGNGGRPLVQDGKVVGVLSWTASKRGKNILGFLNVKPYLPFIQSEMIEAKFAEMKLAQ